MIIVHCFSWQDVSHEDIPIMLVGNKSDLRQGGIGCVPASYGEKLAMVITNKKPFILPDIYIYIYSYLLHLQLWEKSYKL